MKIARFAVAAWLAVGALAFGSTVPAVAQQTLANGTLLVA
jgi:hypothetical protein